MRKLLDLAKELSRRKATPFTVIPGAFIFTDQTPAHRFATIVAPICEAEYCVVLPSRDSFDQSLAIAVFAFVAKQESVLSIEKPLILLDSFACPQYSFDAVAVLSPAAAKQFEMENEVLNNRAFVAFPIFHCELSGDESPELIDFIRHDFLPSLDWKRSPCPKVTMAYRNNKNKSGSGTKLTKLSTALYEVEELYGSEGSWVELRNYAGRECRVSWSQGHYMVQRPGQEDQTLDKDRLFASITLFLTDNQEKPRPH